MLEEEPVSPTEFRDVIRHMTENKLLEHDERDSRRKPDSQRETLTDSKYSFNRLFRLNF
jgi:hypothetical protein